MMLLNVAGPRPDLKGDPADPLLRERVALGESLSLDGDELA